MTRKPLGNVGATRWWAALAMAGGLSVGACAHHHHHDHDDYDRVVIVDEHGFRHEGYRDERGHWRGGYYDEGHRFHEDRDDWDRDRR